MENILILVTGNSNERQITPADTASTSKVKEVTQDGKIGNITEAKKTDQAEEEERRQQEAQTSLVHSDTMSYKKALTQDGKDGKNIRESEYFQYGNVINVKSNRQIDNTEDFGNTFKKLTNIQLQMYITGWVKINNKLYQLHAISYGKYEQLRKLIKENQNKIFTLEETFQKKKTYIIMSKAPHNITYK